MQDLKIIHEKLREPFDPRKIKWRVGATNREKTKGIALAYIDSREVMKRLDDVVGFENWQTRYAQKGLCEISIKLNNEWITKSNAAGETAFEGVKGEASDSFKRAAVLWGVGRYLYYLPNSWYKIKQQGKSFVLDEEPVLPRWAKPEQLKAQK